MVIFADLHLTIFFCNAYLFSFINYMQNFLTIFLPFKKKHFQYHFIFSTVKAYHFFLILFSSVTHEKQNPSSSKLFFSPVLRHLQNSTLSPVSRMLLFIDNHIVTSVFKHSKDFIKRSERTTAK